MEITKYVAYFYENNSCFDFIEQIKFVQIILTIVENKKFVWTFLSWNRKELARKSFKVSIVF